MNTSIKTISSLALAATLALPAAAMAHPSNNGEHAEPIHVVEDSYSSCFFDLHSELTQGEFDTFAAEAGTITRFQQDSSAATLGRGNFDVGLAMTSTPIDDSKGAWNNTMSHPDAEHDLGHDIRFPRIVARMGVTDSVDIGIWGSLDPNANYGFVGIESKIALLKQNAQMPLSVAVRPNASAIVGPSEVFVGNASVDVSVSHEWRGLSPYLGVAAMANVAVENSDEVDLDPSVEINAAAFAGLAYQWRGLRAAAQGETGPVDTGSLLLGGTF